MLEVTLYYIEIDLIDLLLHAVEVDLAEAFLNAILLHHSSQPSLSRTHGGLPLYYRSRPF